jgi:hypothetical protein
MLEERQTAADVQATLLGKMFDGPCGDSFRRYHSEKEEIMAGFALFYGRLVQHLQAATRKGHPEYKHRSTISCRM